MDTPSSPDVSLDAERQEKAREYARIRRRFTFLGLGLSAVYLILWLAFGWHTALGDWIAGITVNPWIAVPLFAFLFALPYSLIDTPFSYYTGYVLPHRYGQSTQDFKGWLGDQVKGLAVGAPIGLIILEVIYLLLRAAPDLWWLYAAIFMLVFGVILSTLAPVLIAPLFNKFVPLEDEDLVARLTRLGEQAGAEVKGVFRFDMSRRTKSANAAVMGLGRTRRIVLGDTLLDEFTADEIETVLAHELGHHVHRDIPLGIAINSLSTLLTFWVAGLIMNRGVTLFGLNGVGDPAGLPLLMAVTGVLGLISMPFGNAYSRWRERMADRYALETTRKPEAFADAMTRLANQNLADADPERWVVLMFYSHPPIKERVAAAAAFGRG
jgi:STE24 endopeptidase